MQIDAVKTAYRKRYMVLDNISDVGHLGTSLVGSSLDVLQLEFAGSKIGPNIISSPSVLSV